MSEIFEPSLKSYIRKNLEVTRSIGMSSSSTRTRRGLQHMSFLKFENKKDQAIYESVLSHAIKAESISPLAGIVFLKLCCDLSVENLCSVPQNKKEVIDLIKSRDFNSSVQEIIFSCLDLCDVNTRINLKKSSNSNSYIELLEGYSFECKPLIKVNHLFFDFCYISCIDGYIESVSEIHHLLSSLSENKEACIIFCRGMSDDVLHTIKVNNERKTLQVYPFLVPFDAENVNTIVDIAVVSDSDVTSSLKGDLISAIETKNLGCAYGCSFTSTGSINIKRAKNKKRIQDHVDALKKNLEERKELSEIFSKRIRNLSTSCLEISIPDDVDYYSKSQQIDEGIRILSSVINNTFNPLSVAQSMYDSFRNTVSGSNFFYFD
jgi:hypothetical protein